jgi:hypothetical protein
MHQTGLRQKSNENCGAGRRVIQTRVKRTDGKKFTDSYSLTKTSPRPVSPFSQSFLHDEQNQQPTDFEPAQEEGRLSPDSRDLVNYESYIRRELPRLVRSSIEEVVRREMQPFEASLVGNLVGIIQDCQDRVFRSYRKHELSTSEDMELSLPDNAGVMPRSRSDDVREIIRPENETEMESDFIEEIFQPTPTANQVPERYVPDPQLFDLFDDPNHLMPSDSGYGSEQLCSCIFMCNCNGSSSDDAGQGREMENRVFGLEQDWCSYPACNQGDLTDRELGWNGGA